MSKELNTKGNYLLFKLCSLYINEQEDELEHKSNVKRER